MHRTLRSKLEDPTVGPVALYALTAARSTLLRHLPCSDVCGVVFDYAAPAVLRHASDAREQSVQWHARLLIELARGVSAQVDAACELGLTCISFVMPKNKEHLKHDLAKVLQAEGYTASLFESKISIKISIRW